MFLKAKHRLASFILTGSLFGCGGAPAQSVQPVPPPLEVTTSAQSAAPANQASQTESSVEPGSDTRPTSSRVALRSGEAVEGRIIGILVLAPEEKKENDGAYTLVLHFLNGRDITDIDAQGVHLRDAPDVTVGAAIAVDEKRAPDLTEVLTTWVKNAGDGHIPMELMRTPSGTLIRVGAVGKPERVFKRRIIGELSTEDNPGGQPLVDSIRLETPKGTVMVPISNLVEIP